MTDCSSEKKNIAMLEGTQASSSCPSIETNVKMRSVERWCITDFRLNGM